MAISSQWLYLNFSLIHMLIVTIILLFFIVFRSFPFVSAVNIVVRLCVRAVRLVIVVWVIYAFEFIRSNDFSFLNFNCGMFNSIGSAVVRVTGSEGGCLG
jgi:hypothetical protein